MARLIISTSIALLLFSSVSFAADDLKTDLPKKQVESETKKADIEFLHNHPTLVKMWEHSNKLRRDYGLAEQKISPALTKAAQDHAWYMAKTGEFSHYTNLGPSGRVRKHKYAGNFNGEILIYGSKTIKSAFNGWLNSPGHRVILLGGGKEVGYGYAISKNGTPYWVGVYGNPRK
ncbi:MAG: hypothetical protein COA78_06350 [Blastopirellula sp.]|nr:MAG: hypothetical protein COA78_06350 [Blastopirellula sp.]